MPSAFKKIIIISAALTTLAFLIFSQSEPAKPDQKNLVVGLQNGYPPFEFMSSSGDIIGFDVDVAQLIADNLSKTLVIQDMEFEGEILSLKQGKIDLIMSGMNITSSRLKEILMVPYHGETATSLSLIFWNKIPAGIHSLEDLAKHPNGSVSVEAGSVSEEAMTLYPAIQAKAFQGALAPLMDVKYGKSLANLVELDVAEYLQKQHPEITTLTVTLPKDQALLGFGIGIKKGNQELYEQVSKIIQELKATGKLKALEDKWFRGEA